MIAIVNLDQEKSNQIKNILDELGIENSISLNESVLLKSKGIILPNVGVIEKAVKLLHLKNLFSALKMCNKPILGLGNGAVLMCDSLIEGNTSCLGYFPLFPEKKENIIESGYVCTKERTSKIFIDKDEISFSNYGSDYMLNGNEFSSFIFCCNKNILSGIIEKNNHIGVLFEIFNSEIERDLFTSFEKLC
jgi:imidazoleglycerol phosphate synthase glutamine amidotransferase subunit HisH